MKKRNTGNQHQSRRRELMAMLHYARSCLRDGYLQTARMIIGAFWNAHNQVPASTRRRWRCGR